MAPRLERQTATRARPASRDDGGDGSDRRGVHHPLRPQVHQGARRDASPRRPATRATQPPLTFFSPPRALPLRRRSQGDFAAPAAPDDDDASAGSASERAEANRSVASTRLVDLLRKTSHDPTLLKVPLRVLRDEILTRYDAGRARVRTSAASTTAGRAADEDNDAPPPPDDVAALFALFDGAHRVCVTLASRLTTGPYETVDRALRLRLFLCVCGETWRDRPRLRAEALRLCHAFAREEDTCEGLCSRVPPVPLPASSATSASHASTPSSGGSKSGAYILVLVYGNWYDIPYGQLV